MNEQFQEVIETIQLLQEEEGLSKNFNELMNKVIKILQSDSDLALVKALHELEGCNSIDMPSYHRTQVWGVISHLESLK